MARQPAQPDGRLWIGAPNDLMHPRTTQDGPNPGAGVMGNHYSTIANQRNTMWNQPAFGVYPPMGPGYTPPSTEQADLMNGFPGSRAGLPTFFPVGNRAAVTVHAAQGGQPEGIRMLLVPPDRFNALANTRRGPHDVRNIARRGTPSRRRVFGIPVGS